MKTYEANATISKEEWERLNALLDILDMNDEEADPEELEHLRDDLDAEEDDEVDVVSAAFENGVKLSFSLRSGQSNYWVETEFVLPDGQVLEADPGYDLSKDMEADIFDGPYAGEYVIHITLTED